MIRNAYLEQIAQLSAPHGLNHIVDHGGGGHPLPHLKVYLLGSLFPASFECHSPNQRR